MNKIYKTSWNRARGAVTVSSEVSSSVQGMGAKSIIAAAVTAMIAGGAMAAEGDIWTDRVITEDVTIASGTTEYVNSAVMQGGTLTVAGRLYYDSKNSKGDFTLRDGTINVTGQGSYEVRDLVISGGKITATGESTVDEAHGRTLPAVGAYNSWLMTGGDIELSKSGRIWIGSSNKNDPTAYGRMALQGGTVTLNEGGYITGNKRLIKAGEYYDGTVVVGEDTLAGNTIGFDGATVTVKGAGNVIDALYTEQTAGTMTVEAGAALTVRATTSTNNATEEALDAIRKNSTWTIAGGEFVNKGTVNVDVRELLVSGGSLTLEEGAVMKWDYSDENYTLDRARIKVTGGEIALANKASIEMRTAEIAGGHIAVGNDKGAQEGVGVGTSVRTLPAFGAYDAFTMTGGTIDLGNNGRLWIGSADTAYNAMNFLGGTVNMNGTKEYQSWITGTVTEAEGVNNGNTVVLGGTTLNVNGYGEVNAAHIEVDGSAITVAANGALTFASTYGKNSTNAGKEFTTGTLKFTSGSFNVAGLLKSEIAAEMAGDFTMTDVVVGSLASGATEPTTGFRFDKTLTVTGGTTTITGKLANATSSLVLDGGVLAVNASSIFNEGLTGLDADTAKITTTGEAEGGILEVNFGGATLTEAALKTLKNAVYDGRWSAVGLTISDFTPEEDGTISAEDSLLVGDAIASDYAVSAGTTGKLDATSVSGQVDVSKLTAVEGKKTVTIDGSTSGEATVTLIGKNGALTNDTGVVNFTVADTLVIGSEAVNNGAVTHNGGISGTGTLELVNTNLTVSNISTTTTNVASNATVTADTVSTSGTVSGTLVANTITGGTSGLTVAGAAQVNGPTGAEGAATSALAGKVNVEDAGIIATNLAAAKRVAAQIVAEDVAAGETDVTAPAILYVDKQLKVASGAAITVGTDPTDGAAYVAPRAGGENVILKENGMLVVDASAFTLASAPAEGDTTDYSVLGSGTTVDTGTGEVYFVNTTKTGLVYMGGALTVAGGTEALDYFDTDSIYVVVEDVAATTGVVELGFNGDLIANQTVSGKLESRFAQGLSAKEASILYALQDNTAFWAEDDTAGTLSYTAAGQKAYEQATGGNVTAGVLNVAYDVNAQVTDAIVRHQLADHSGYGAWADVFYASNEAKKLYGNSGYKADIYGGVLGFDATFSCGATGGIALTIGQADADTVGGALKNSVDSDFWGVSLYAAKDFAGLNVKMDVGYIDFSNDFSGIGDASDASTFTVGLRGDYAAYAGDMFSVVPHVGLRYTKIDTDSVAFNDEQTMDVLEAPIGVKVVGTVEANGWKVLPAVDFTVVPQLGDKDVKAFGYANDVTVLSGGLYNTTVGVEAVNGNLAFGLNASYGFGPDDRANTMVNANVRYSF